jgi:hypothetical protein
MVNAITSGEVGDPRPQKSRRQLPEKNAGTD